MKAHSHVRRVLLTLALFGLLVRIPSRAADPNNTSQPSVSRSAGQPQEVRLPGRVICLPEEMNRLHGVGLPTKHDHIWGLRADDGKLYTLLRGKFSEAIFLDERLREKKLLLKARVFPNTQVIEVITIHSIRNEVVQDLYYYCDICAVKAVSPEPCACCQGPVQLVERPLSENGE
jgi:hypothetical protein